MTYIGNRYLDTLSFLRSAMGGWLIYNKLFHIEDDAA